MATVGRLNAFLSAETAQFEARLDAAARAVDKMTSSTAVANRAVGQVRGGMQGLANQAFATLGPVGQLTTSLATLTGGVTALVATGVAGGVFLWFNHVTKRLADASKLSQDLNTQWQQMAAARIGSPLLSLMGERAPFEAMRDITQTQIESRQSSLMGLFQRDPNEPATQRRFAADPLLQQLESQLQAINGIINEIERKPEQILVGLRRELQLLELPKVSIEKVVELQAQWAGLTGKTAEEYQRLHLAIADLEVERIWAGLGAEMERQLQLQPVDLRDAEQFALFPKAVGRRDGKGSIESAATLEQSLGKADLATSIVNQLVAQEQQLAAVRMLETDATFQAMLAAEGLTEEFNAMVRGMNRAEIKSQQLAVALVSAVSGAIQAVMGGGGIGSVVSGAGSILSALSIQNPGLLVPGVILSGLGGIFSAFDNAEERRHRELKSTIEKLGQEVGLDRVTVVFTGADGHQIRRTLAQLEDSDGVERIPSSAGARG